MKMLFIMVWLFPILFMLHDFEEIVMVNVWQKRNEEYIKNRKNKYIPFNFRSSTSAFSIAVDEEFAIISLVSILSCLFNNYIIWFGLFIAFIIHFVLHLLMCLDFKKYVPGVTTTILFLPVCCFIVYKFNSLMHYKVIPMLLSVIISTLIFLINIYVLHKAIEKFSCLLEKYSIHSI